MRTRSLDLLAAVLVSVLTLAVAFTGSLNEADRIPVWFLPFGILMVLFIPGYVLTLAILPELDRATTLVLSLGLSVSMDILGGLILNSTPRGLHPVSWAAWLSTFSLLACVVAARRRSLIPPAAAAQYASPRWNWRAVAGILLTAAMITTAIVIARTSAMSAGTPVTELWAVPRAAEGGYAAEIGIHNQETATIHYQLYAEYRGTTMNRWTDIVLRPGDSWSTSMPLLDRPQYPITFLLYTTSAPEKAYRIVQLAPASFDELVPLPAGQ